MSLRLIKWWNGKGEIIIRIKRVKRGEKIDDREEEKVFLE